jgi:hypothetical protein
MDEVVIRSKPSEAIFYYSRSGAGSYGVSHRSILLYPEYFVQCWRTSHAREPWGGLKDARHTGYVRRQVLQASIVEEIMAILDQAAGLRSEVLTMDSSDSFESKKFEIRVAGDVRSLFPASEEIWMLLMKASGFEQKPLAFASSEDIDQQYAHQKSFWLPDEIEIDREDYECPSDARDPLWNY